MKAQFLAPLLFLFASCAGTHNTSNPEAATTDKSVAASSAAAAGSDPASEKENPQNKPGKEKVETYRLVVSFFSKGEGIDEKALVSLNDLIADFEKRNNTRLEVEKTRWGREGEIDYCIQMQNLDSERQMNFILQTREILIQSQLVHIVENAPCVHMQ